MIEESSSMGVPTYETMILPLLKFLEDKQEKNYSQVIDGLIEHFKLSKEVIEKEMRSGGTYFYNRITWTKKNLTEAGLLEERVGKFQISDKGLEILKQKPPEINNAYLRELVPDNKYFHNKGRKRDNNGTGEQRSSNDPYSPDEIIDEAVTQINDDLTIALSKKLANIHPTFFEKLVLDLVEELGYGETKHVGKPHDGGIDGEIYADKLGLNTIYLQAKRHKNTVSTADMDKFMGALSKNKARYGIFITTSGFPKHAYDDIKGSDKHIILINGEQLIKHMIEVNLGLKTKKTIIIKEINDEYLPE